MRFKISIHPTEKGGFRIVLNCWSLETGNMWDYYKVESIIDGNIVETIPEYTTQELAEFVANNLTIEDFKIGYIKKVCLLGNYECL